MQPRLLAALGALIILCISTPAPAEPAATPQGWGTAEARARTDAFIAGKLAVFRDQSRRSLHREALSLVQMLRPDEPTAVHQLAFYIGPDAPDFRYRELLDFEPGEPLANYYLGQTLSQEGYARLALPYFRKVVDARPSESGILFSAGINAFYAGENAVCIDYLSRALAGGLTDDNMYQARLKRGECHARSGQLAQAKADLVTVGSGEYPARMLADGAYRCRGGNLDDRARRAARIADDWKAYEGYRELTGVLMCDPNHPEALRQMLIIEKRDNNLKRHARTHEVQLQAALDGGQAEAARMAKLKAPTVAAMLAEAGGIKMPDDPKGEKRMRVAYLASRVLMLEPNNAEALLLRARALTNMSVDDLSPQAWDDATRALAANPRSASAYHVRALLLTRRGDYAGAAAEASAAIAIDPAQPRFYALRGEALVLLKQYDAGIRDLTRYLATNPKDITSLIRRAQGYYGLKQYPAALADFDAVLAIDGKHYMARIAAIQLLDAMGRTAEADNRHLAMLVEDEKAANANTNLAKRTTPALLARVAEAKGRAKAERTWSEFYDQYSKGEATMNDLIQRVDSPVHPNDRALEMAGLRMLRDHADDYMTRAWEKGLVFIDTPEFDYLSEDRQVQFAVWMNQVKEARDQLAQLKAGFR